MTDFGPINTKLKHGQLTDCTYRFLNSACTSEGPEFKQTTTITLQFCAKPLTKILLKFSFHVFVKSFLFYKI
jgi:hypothetical protein